MADFEKLYGEVLVTPTVSTVSFESVLAALADVALEVKETQEVILVDKDGAIFRKQDDGDFHLNPKMDYVIMRQSASEIAAMIKKKEEADRKEADRKARANVEVASFAKRDALRAIELDMQKIWDADKMFELDAPTTAEERLVPKFMATFPYPYMNGRLHLGHTFTLAKCEFAVGYERLKGKNAIFPFGFHCTGMPIKVAADKLAYEMETFGVPPVFPPVPETLDVRIFAHDPEKKRKAGKSKKSKAASKTAAGKYQWDIMKNSDVPIEEIPKFAKGEHWIGYFPPIAISDLKRMGSKIDWRRSFVTTDLNPFYDSFVKWQFNRLKATEKVAFGKRNTIYSPKDKGPCMDHDRDDSGQGVVPTEYTIVKQELLKPFPSALASLESSGKKVFLVPATLRPETMYGQTNCWVLPTGEYGAFEVGDEIFICTHRAAYNMAFQLVDDKSDDWGQVKQLLSFTGQDLIGAALKAPLTSYEKIYVLPMLSVLSTKGTGVVTSVPSDSPDDFTAMRDLIQKPDFRKKFGVTDEMVLPFKVINIINIPELGDCAAQTVVEAMKIKSANDRVLLEKAKEEVYTKGFYSGTLLVGPYAGKKVEDVKSIIRDELIAAKLALPYAEPASEVKSRSGDICVVALIDQWYLNYGEKDWEALASKCLKHMTTFGDESRQMMEAGLAWIKQWACSRSFGLGTRLPWDETFLIDSLSDSTIYMAYYTVAHLLHKDLEGQILGEAGIPASDMTDAVWDYILLGVGADSENGGNISASVQLPATVSIEILAKMRSEFTYWYPVDLRVSGKDLVKNHLIFWIYNHVAIWDNDETKWPKAVRPNGHVLLNKMKMAKSTGNFISLYDGVERFTADGMRFALADAGDGISDDSNFTTDSADGALLKLYTQIEWTKEILSEMSTLRTGAMNFADQVFEAQLSLSVDLTDRAFENMEYKEGVKTGFFELQTFRDAYQDMCKLLGEKMHADLVSRFIRTQALLLAPICPHWSEYIWTALLKEPKSIMFARFPKNENPTNSLRLTQYTYLQRVTHTWRLKLESFKKPKKGPAQPTPPKATIVVARKYPDWHEAAIQTLEKLYKEGGNVLPDQTALIAGLRAVPIIAGADPKILKNAMAAARLLSEEHATKGDEVFSLTLPWDEIALLQENSSYISGTLGVPKVVFVYSDDASVSGDATLNPTPGNPAISFTA